jgi:thiosulfate dehydrogenase
MPSAITNGWTLNDVRDVLTYAQGLPTEGSDAHVDAILLGGTLYDKWWSVLAVDAPADDNPLWASQSTNERAGGDTWRCKECHGWDYKGSDGAYGSGSHFTGFPGIWDAQGRADELLVAMLEGETDPDHDFSAYLGDEELQALAAFINEGLDDYTPLIDADKKAVDGDAVQGGELFAATCSVCHGADGTTLNFGSDDEPEYVGTIAVDNPWEFFHKVRVGQPGTGMPSAIANGWSLEDVLNILSFAQTLQSE